MNALNLMAGLNETTGSTDMGPQWKGVELIGAVPELRTTDSQRAPRDSKKIVKGLAKAVRHTGCDTFDITIGFLIRTQTWYIRLDAREHRGVYPELDSIWPRIVATMFRNCLDIPEQEVRRRSMKDPKFGDSHDWEELALWQHRSKFSLYRGVPFVEQLDGEKIYKELAVLMLLKEDDTRAWSRGEIVSAKALVPEKKGRQRDMEHVLDSMINGSSCTVM